MSLGITSPQPHPILASIERTEATRQAKAGLIAATANTTDDIILSKEQIALVVEDCFNDIANKKIDGPYIAAVIEGVGMYIESKKNQDEEVKNGVEQLLALASRTIKGEQCPGCGDQYCSGSGVSPTIHRLFFHTIFEMMGPPQTQPSTWTLSHRARFSLNKLCDAFDDIYGELRYIIKVEAGTMDGEFQGQLEEMWCHHPWDEYDDARYDGCGCWDKWSAYGGYGHLEGCWGYDAACSSAELARLQSL